MPCYCVRPGSKRQPYQKAYDATCRGCAVYWALNQGLAEVVQVLKKGVGHPVAVDTSAWTANTMHTNNTAVHIYQENSNADSEWRVVRVSERPEDLTSDNVRVFLVYTKSGTGPRNFLPSEIVSAAAGISNKKAAADIASNIAKSKKYTDSFAEKKERGENTKRRVWDHNYTSTSALCIDPGCKCCPSEKVAGFKSMPHSLEDAFEVLVQEGYLEVTILLKKDFIVEGNGEFYTMVFNEAISCPGGFSYDGKRYEYNKDAWMVLANACSSEEVELESFILKTPLSSPEALNDRKEQWKKNLDSDKLKMQERRSDLSPWISDVVQDRATPECLEKSKKLLFELIDRNVKNGLTVIYIAKGGASRSLELLIRDLLDQYNEETTNTSKEGFLAWLEAKNNAVYNQAIKAIMKRYEGLGFITEDRRGPPALELDGSSLNAHDLYQDNLSSHIPDHRPWT